MNYYILYFSLYVGAFLLSVMGLWFTVIVTGIDRWSKRFFMGYFLIFMLCCLSSIVETTFQDYTVPKAVYYFMLLFATLLLSLPLPMMTVYLLHCCDENIRSSRLLHAVLGLWAVFFILLDLIGQDETVHGKGREYITNVKERYSINKDIHGQCNRHWHLGDEEA